MQLVLLENSKRNFGLLRDHAARFHTTIFVFVEDKYYPRSGVYEVWNSFESIDYTGDKVIQIFTDTKTHHLKGKRNIQKLIESIYSKEHDDLEKFVSSYFSSVTWAFGFIFEQNGD
jgi:hypothetical protein